jgi:hypothetical protein
MKNRNLSEAGEIMHYIDHFFEGLDTHLKQQINTISCDKLADIYFNFISKVDSYFASTRDFTGLTELIIFRGLYYLYIEEINKGNVELLANTLVGKRQPDITVKHNNKFCSVISIKSNMDTGYSRIKKDFMKTEEIVVNYPYIKSLTISFDDRKTSGQHKLMDTYRTTSKFYNFVFLKNNTMKFKDIANSFIFPAK